MENHLSLKQAVEVAREIAARLKLEIEHAAHNRAFRYQAPYEEECVSTEDNNIEHRIDYNI